jgi:thiamine pyrophosphate-dependent acetolactate synthase large subunit-like protein
MQMAEPRQFLLVVVSDRPAVADSAARALHALTAGSDRRLEAGCVAVPPGLQPVDALRDVTGRARRYLDRTVAGATFALVVAGSLAEVPAAVATAGPGVIALLVVDHLDHRYRPVTPPVMAERLHKLAADLPTDVLFEPSPVTVQVYTDRDTDLALAVDLYTRRWTPAEEWVVVADLACAFTDSIQARQLSRYGGDPEPSTLAATLAEFLDRQAGNSWGVHYYTGSVVAQFIEDLDRHARTHGNPVVRGPSEHSLACSALARWQLDGAPFVITVTSGMADEFRGTLANLRAARARGFVVCADSRADQWYPFQGTIHRGVEDSREVMRARGLPTIHIDGPDRLAESLSEAFAAYLAGQGPVVLFVTREVLEASGAVESPTPGPAATPPVEVTQRGLDELVELVNGAPKRVLCQAGPLTPRAADLLHELATRAGIGLADSLPHPGTVSRYRRGRPVEEYLGTLSLYGYSARVHQFLHREGRLRPDSEQAVLFVNSRVAEVDTPFSVLATRRMRPVQIVEREADVAPFAGLGVAGPIEDVLAALVDRLDVDPEVLALRKAAIGATSDSFSDVAGLIPVQPMTPNHFFRRLSDLLDGLIRDHGYRYLGVFDVGRAGLSAVCNLPRTGPGHSGWFGRALMGDALSALPGIAHGRDDNVLAFVGDGAAALVPDPLPALVHQIVVDRVPWRRNLSVFRFVNGAHSVIRTYREAFQPSAVSGQTGVLSVNPGDWRREFDGLVVSHRRICSFDADTAAGIATALRRPGTIDLYTVALGHNNEGDGLSILATLGWQRDELTRRTLAMAGGMIA